MKELELWKKAIQTRKDSLKNYPKGSENYFAVKEAIEEIQLRVKHLRRRHLFNVLRKK